MSCYPPANDAGERPAWPPGFGIVTGQGIAGVGTLIALVEDQDAELLLTLAQAALLPIVGQMREVHENISEVDSQIHAWHRSNELSRRLETIPGIGPITASAIAATVADATLFKSGRQLAAWIGLVPRQNSSGGKDRLGRISKQGDPYLRRLLVVGAHAVFRFSGKGKAAFTRWAAELLAKKPSNIQRRRRRLGEQDGEDRLGADDDRPMF